MRRQKMHQFWAIIFLSLALNNHLTEARHEKKLPSAVVVGTVYCDTCFHQSFSKASHFISGALVAVECADTKSRTSFREEVKTNEHGEFKVHLPFSVSKHVKKIKRCSVKLISSSEPYCGVASTATSSSLHLKSRKEGTHIFSAGFFTFKPLNQPALCDQKPSVQNSRAVNTDDSLIPNPNPSAFFPPPIQDPPSSDLPPIGQDLPPLPQLPNLPPLPMLPPLPPLPGMPFLPPVPKKTTVQDEKVTQTQFFGPNPFQPPSLFPPNPLQPPPSILPPVVPSPPASIFPPLFPSPPPSIFPPFFPSPPPSPVINFPPIPGFTPSPSPPPPPIFQFPLPPFPFQPIPGFPGVPPAATPSPKKNP